jgi:cytochrome c biogenesis protein CcmG, thiol:disulfide interchange protein DsbE
MTRWVLLLPVLALLILAGILGVRLWQAGALPEWASGERAADATHPPRPAPPVTAVPLLPDVPGFATSDFGTSKLDASDFGTSNLGSGFVLVNVFASWCAPCQIEHPRLMELSRHLPIYGIAFGDKAAAVHKMLSARGNPFARINDDPNGTASVAWGVTGVPESFLVSPQGQIVWHFAGPLTELQTGQIVQLLPRTEKLSGPEK